MLKTEDIHFAYGRGREILKGLNLVFPAKGLVSILGPNGSGKTTLVKCLGGILKCSSGDIYIDGENMKDISGRQAGRLIGYVPQEYGIPYHMCVFDFVMLGRIPYINWSIGDRDRAAVNDTLAFMNLGHLAETSCQALSGGQKQMVSIARCLSQNTATILMDEPLSALDIKHSLEVMSKMTEIAEQRRALIILVMHDIQMAARYSDHIVVLKQGELYSSGTAREVVTSAMLRDVYDVEIEVCFDDLGCRLNW